MPTVVSEKHGKVHIPARVVDLPSFRRWVHSDDVPEKLRAHFLSGEVWVDLSMEEAFSHNFVKTAMYQTLLPLTAELGLLFSDGMLLTNDVAGLATEPDCMFLSNESLESGRVRLTAGKHAEADATEVTGSPDIAIEVVSRSTEEKDTEWLMSAYHNAGVREYWVVDARDEDAIAFDIYRRGSRGYNATKKSDGWVKSAILGRAFRLTRKEGKHGYPRFTLEVR